MNLTTKALLIQLNISQWSARKYDKKTTKAVNQQNGASDSAGRFNKALLPAADKLDAIHKLSSKIRTEYYRQTLPWGMEGTQLLPTTNYMDFMQEFGAMKSQWEALVKDFVNDYPQLVASAQTQLGQLYDSADYPPVNILLDKFSMSVSVMPVPSTDFRVAIQDEELEKIKADVESRVKQAEAAAMRELWDRLYQRVKNVAEKLAEPDAIFRDSLIGNVQEICSILPKLNVADDPELEQMRQEVEASLTNKNPEAIRHSVTLRESTAQQAKAIADKMAAYMGGAI